jgi:pimeloyl-ACP methyl ester carboxylesterase
MAALPFCFHAPKLRGFYLSKDCNTPAAFSVLRVICVLVASLCLVPGVFGSSAQIAGHWEGTMFRDGASLQVSFDFSTAGPQPKGTFTSMTQQAMDYPLDGVTIGTDGVHFAIGDSLVFDGKLISDRIVGTFTDDGAGGKFTLHRSLSEVLPYDVVAVIFRNGTVALSGTVCMPRSPGRHAAVVILQGSGSETRWGTNRFIADQFARSGIAALVYDKRGSGLSTGDWKASSYDDLANDVLAGIALLASRPDIDPSRIGLHGHSEGGIIAAIVAVHAPSKVAFVVAEDTVAGLVRDQDVYRVSHQIQEAGFTDSQKKRALNLYKLMLDVACGTKPYQELETASQPFRDQEWYKWLAIPPQESYLWTWYPKIGNLDTLVFWRQVRAPVLLVYGERDQLEPVDESLAKIEASLDILHTPYTALIAPNAQHNLTVQPKPNEPFFWWKSAPGIIDLVVAWVQHETTMSVALESTSVPKNQ